MSDPNFSAIRARLRYESISEFVEGYGRYISRGGMFVPMAAQKLKPVGTTVRFQFLLADGTSAMLGEGIVRQIKGVEDSSGKGPVGMLVKFTKLSPDTKSLVARIVDRKSGAMRLDEDTPKPASSAQEAPAPIGDDERQNQPTPMHGTDALNLAAAASVAGVGDDAEADADSEEDTDTGVLDDSSAEALRQQGAGAPAADDADHTAEVELPTQAPTGESTSGDEIFGTPEESSSLGDDPSFAVAEALAADSSAVEDSPPFEAADQQESFESAGDDPPFSAVGDEDSADADIAQELEDDEADQDLDGDSLFGDDDDFLGEMLSEAGIGPEGAAEEAAEASPATPESAAGDLIGDDSDDDQAEEAPVALDLEAEGDVEDSDGGEVQEEESEEPQAIKKTAGGIKVMSFDGDEAVDEMAAREFEEFTSGSEEDDFDAMFDGVFGGGGDGGDGLFGGSDDGGDGGGGFFGDRDDGSGEAEPGSDDPFGAGDQETFEEAPDEAKEVAEAPQEPAPQPPKVELSADIEEPDEISEAALDVDSEWLVDEASESEADAEPPAAMAPPQAQPQAPPAEDSGRDDTGGELGESVEDDGGDKPRKSDEDSSERIRSLLAMDSETEQAEGGEMVLNLGGGLADEEEDEDEGDADDSMEFLLASAQKEIQEKSEKEEEEEERDILDELLGDGELPPAGGPPSLNVPQPKGKKKRKGFISKFFGDD